MKTLAFALPFLAASIAWADDGQKPLPTRMSLDQDVERESNRPNEGGPGVVMDYIYAHSRLETGLLFTNFDGNLDLDDSVGAYLRYGVEVAPMVSVNLNYRYYDFENSAIPGSTSEGVRIHGLTAGVGFMVPITEEFTFEAGAGIGVMRWDGDSRFHDETGSLISGETALSVWLTEAIRLKAGLVLDGVRTDFHQSSSETGSNLSFLIGIQIGGM